MSGDGHSEPRLSLILPAYNEEGNIRPVIQEAVDAMAGTPVIDSYEIVVVDDGSSDGTAREADAVAAENPSVRVLHHPRNRGIGAAIKTGYAAARGTWVTAVGSDGEVAMTDVMRLVELMPDADLVVSRRRRGSGVHRKLFTYGFHRLTHLIVGFDIEGMEGIYVIRRDLLRSFPLYSETSLVNLEVIMRCVRQGRRIRSGEIAVRPRLSGESKMTNWRAIARVFREMLKLRVHLWRSEKKDDRA